MVVFAFDDNDGANDAGGGGGNLLFHIDASDTSSITDSSGDVSQIDDLSGNGNHPEQSTGSIQPRTGDDTINSKNVLTFAADDYLEVSTTDTIDRDTTIFIVMEMDSLGGAFYTSPFTLDVSANNKTVGPAQLTTLDRSYDFWNGGGISSFKIYGWDK